MAQHSKRPEVLQELFEALGNDPFIIAECLARPALAERLLTNWYAYDQKIHGELKQRAETELRTHDSVDQMKQLSGTYSEIEFVNSQGDQGEEPRHHRHGVALNTQEWDQIVRKLSATFSRPGSHPINGKDGLPGRPAQSARPAVAPYQDLPIGKLSPLQEDQDRYYATAVVEKTNEHLKLATISWTKEALHSWLAKEEKQLPAAVVTPSPNYTLPKLSDGGCIDDTWTATPGPPDGREGHTAVWTGSEMIIWGGQIYAFSGTYNTGGRYNPNTDTWTPTSTVNAPTPRALHTAVWTGSEMIVWGGLGDSSDWNTGGRYNPVADSWTPTVTTGAPEARDSHTAVWTGSEMIVWGG